jgi:ABC-type tungstate transport system substrate-binding protein
VLKLVATMLEEQACYLIGVSLAGFGKILLHIRCHLYMTGDVNPSGTHDFRVARVFYFSCIASIISCYATDHPPLCYGNRV